MDHAHKIIDRGGHRRARVRHHAARGQRWTQRVGPGPQRRVRRREAPRRRQRGRRGCVRPGHPRRRSAGRGRRRRRRRRAGQGRRGERRLRCLWYCRRHSTGASHGRRLPGPRHGGRLIGGDWCVWRR